MRRLTRTVVVALVAGLLLALLLPFATALASITGHSWLGATYVGWDPFLGSVTAYETGSTAELVTNVWNNVGNDITVREAVVEFDWEGGTYSADGGSLTIAEDKTELITFSITVPQTSVASNLVRHNYDISVVYQREGEGQVGDAVTGEDVGTGDGGTTMFWLNNNPVKPGSETVYLDSTETTSYTMDYYWGLITFDTAPAAGVAITADYEYIEYVGAGDGSNTVFWLNLAPVIQGSEVIYLDGTQTTDYSIDRDIGEITFDTAPGAGVRVTADYEWGNRWTANGTSFAVYSTDQAAAMGLKDQIDAIGATDPDLATARAREYLAESGTEYQLAQQEYERGNFAEATTHYQNSFDAIENALSADGDPAGDYSSLGPVGSLLTGIGLLVLGVGVVLFVMTRPT